MLFFDRSGTNFRYSLKSSDRDRRFDITATTLLSKSKMSPPLYATKSSLPERPKIFSRFELASASASSLEMSPGA